MHASGVSTNPREPRLALGGRIIIPGLSVGHVAYHWIIQSFVVALPEIQLAFGLSSVGVGGVVSAREVAAGVVALPAGVVVDVVRRYWGLLLAACLAACAIGALLMGVWPSLGISPIYWLVLAGIAVVAISHSIWHLPASASLSHHFQERRGMALSFHGVGGSVGDVAGPIVTGALLLYLSWDQMLTLYAVAPLTMGLLGLWAFRNIGRGRDDEDNVSLSVRVAATRALLQTTALWGLMVVRGLRGMALAALVTILPLYLEHELDLSQFNRGFHIGMLIIVGLIAKSGAGYLSDRWGRKRVLVPGLIWSCAMAFLLTVFDSGIGFTITVALLGLFLYPDQPILNAALFDVVGREVASTGLGVVACLSFLMAAVSPLIAGALYDGPGFAVAAYYIAGLFAASAALFLALPLPRRDG